jgi:predicted MPP superfamily phosphohydrolase
VRHLRLLRIAGRSLRRVVLTVGTILALAAAALAYARYLEPHWLCVRHIRLAPVPTVRILHITDIHFTGDTQYLERVVATLNRLDADLIGFTGDLVEDPAYLEDASRILAAVNKPVYGVAGNHDRWALGLGADELRGILERTGGLLLTNRRILLSGKRVALLTPDCFMKWSPAGWKRILLAHDPAEAAALRGGRYDLMLAGHTHGGQFGLPLLRRCLMPYDLGAHVRGLYRTPCGPLYVNPGIGTFDVKMRFGCRPEITRFDL